MALNVFVFGFVFVFVFMLVRSCLLVTLVKSFNGHKSAGSLLECFLYGMFGYTVDEDM